ncbi:MAG TPA: hypothetical protein VGE10_08820 [Zeimonas sp.]
MAERRTPPTETDPRSTSAREHWREADSHRREHVHDPRRPGETDPLLSQKRRDAFLNMRNGVFYPTGHAVLVLSPEDAQAVCDALHEAGFARDSTMLLDAAQTSDLMQASEEQAGFLSEMVGGEIKNLRVVRQLADHGACMLIVRVHGDEEERALVAVAQRWPVHKAMRYHTLAIEEIPVGTEDIPGDSPYGINEVLRNKPSDAQVKPRR